MRRFCLVALLSSLSALSFVACRGDSSGSRPDGGRDSVSGDDTSIQDIQRPPGLSEDPVTVAGVIVTAVDDFGTRKGGFFVEEPGGGEYSGVYVYTMNLSAVAGLQPGDEVTIANAIPDEFALTGGMNPDTSGRKLTELTDPTGGMMSITKTGTGEIPAPSVVDPRDLAASDEEAEKWEGVLVRFETIAVTRGPRGMVEDQREMMVTGPFRVASALTVLADTIADETCYASVTGLVDYFYEYKLEPRNAADLQAGGSGCPAPEADAACDNAMDDDFDGFSDCSDRGCQVLPACIKDGDIPDVQMQTADYPVGTRVRVTNAIVTAVASAMFWIQVGTAPYSGVAVHPTTMPAGLAPGNHVTVLGTIDENFDATELDAADVTVTSVGSASDVPAAAVNPFDTYVDATTAEPYEGMLVKVQNVSVRAVPDGFGEWIVGGSGTAAAMGLHVDDVMADPSPVPTMGTCYASVQGTLHFSFENFKLEPRTAADIVSGGTCP